MPGLASAGCALAIVAAAAGCTERMCTDQVSATGRYRVTIVELYDESTHFVRGASPPTSSMPCAGASGISPGDVFEVKGTGDVGGRGCFSVIADFVSVPDSLQLLGAPAPSFGQDRWKNGGAGFLVAGASVTAPGGAGDLLIELLPGPGSKDLFATPQPGQDPPTIAVSTLYYYSAGPTPLCYDSYVVQLAKE